MCLLNLHIFLIYCESFTGISLSIGMKGDLDDEQNLSVRVSTASITIMNII